jgi:hypothetical protein
MNMDTSDGASHRGGRGGGRYNSRGRGRSDQSNYGGSGGGRYGGQDYQSGGYNQSYGTFNQSNRGNRGRGYWGGRGQSLPSHKTARRPACILSTQAVLIQPAGRSTARGGRTQGRDSGRGRGDSRSGPRLPEDVESLSELKGHTKKVTCLVLDQATGQLFTGSHDATVRVWSCATGECTSTVQVGGEVDSMLIEAGFLFVGVKVPSGQGVVKGWNMADGKEFNLEGHTVWA